MQGDFLETQLTADAALAVEGSSSTNDDDGIPSIEGFVEMARGGQAEPPRILFDAPDAREVDATDGW